MTSSIIAAIKVDSRCLGAREDRAVLRALERGRALKQGALVLPCQRPLSGLVVGDLYFIYFPLNNMLLTLTCRQSQAKNIALLL